MVDFDPETDIQNLLKYCEHIIIKYTEKTKNCIGGNKLLHIY